MKKYKVTQDFMNVLKKWNDEYKDANGVTIISNASLDDLPEIIIDWSYKNITKKECNNRFGAIINWINGEDVFEIGTQKYIVRQKELDYDGTRAYIFVSGRELAGLTYEPENATRFDDLNEASEWANKHFEVVEVHE